MNDFARKFVAWGRHQKMADSLYRVVLGRRPTAIEKHVTAARLQIPTQFEARISEMLHSEEFQIMALPGITVDAIHNWSGKQVFFLHIPKTAGTSVRIALIKAVGTPAFDFYGRLPRVEEKLHGLENNFWPLWVGHQNISIFPNSLAGITVFRETRSRVLSTYRQRSRMAIMDNPHLLDPEKLEKKKSRAHTVLTTPFGSWLGDYRYSRVLTYFIPPEEGTQYRSQEFKTFISNISDSQVERILNKSLSRFTHAAWSHDEPAILGAISGVSGREITELPRENVYPNLEGYPPQILDKDALAKLNAIQEKEAVLFKVAHEHGLIPLLSKSEADNLFELTAGRLGFTFG